MDDYQRAMINWVSLAKGEPFAKYYCATFPDWDPQSARVIRMLNEASFAAADNMLTLSEAPTRHASSVVGTPVFDCASQQPAHDVDMLEISEFRTTCETIKSHIVQLKREQALIEAQQLDLQKRKEASVAELLNKRRKLRTISLKMPENCAFPKTIFEEIAPEVWFDKDPITLWPVNNLDLSESDFVSTWMVELRKAALDTELEMIAINIVQEHSKKPPRQTPK